MLYPRKSDKNFRSVHRRAAVLGDIIGNLAQQRDQRRLLVDHQSKLPMTFVGFAEDGLNDIGAGAHACSLNQRLDLFAF